MTINVLVTDIGEFPVPAYLADAHAKAKLRKDGKVDRRTNIGKRFYSLERTAIGNCLADAAIRQLDAQDGITR